MPKLLIVDDSRVFRLVTRRVVESLGFTTAEAEDGQQAVDYCKNSGPPDAVLLDIIMPVMDGMTCLRALRQDPRMNRCAIIMCSTQNSQEEIAEAIAAGANEYVMKPYTEEILRDKLRQVGLLE